MISMLSLLTKWYVSGSKDKGGHSNGPKAPKRPNVNDAGMEFIVVLCLYYKSLLCSQ